MNRNKDRRELERVMIGRLELLTLEQRQLVHRVTDEGLARAERWGAYQISAASETTSCSMTFPEAPGNRRTMRYGTGWVLASNAAHLVNLDDDPLVCTRSDDSSATQRGPTRAVATDGA